MARYRSEWRTHVFVCDTCGEEIDTDEEDFTEATEVFKARHAIRPDHRGGWDHLCEDCK